MDPNWKRTFFIIWIGQAFSLIGSQLIHFAIAWWLTESTGSAVVLVTVSLFAIVPQVVLGPFIGALVDRWNRRKVMIVADSAIAVVTLWLAVTFMLGHGQIWFLYVASFVRGIMGSFHWSAMQASTSLMVPKEHLARVAGMNQSLYGILNIAAPPLGALLLGLMPLWAIMYIDVGTAAMAVVPLLLVSIPQPVNTSTEMVTPISVLRDVRVGLNYLWKWPGMLMILLMAALINFLLNPTGVLMPLLVTRHFEGGVWHLSAMESGFGFGVIAGGLLLSVWGGFKRRVVTSMAGLALMGLSTLITGLAPVNMFLLAVFGMALSGALNPLINGPLMAILQSRIAPEMQGRVLSLVSSVSGAMAPLGMALAAPVAENLGIRVWWWFGGSLCLLMGLCAFLVPAIMNVEEDADNQVAAAAAVQAAS
jgi:MFS transporter, DHA3 family, macrolide efflux protein